MKNDEITKKSKDSYTAIIAYYIFLPMFYTYWGQVTSSTCFPIDCPFHEKAHLKLPISVYINQNGGK